MSKFLHDAADDARAMTIHRRCFSKTVHYSEFQVNIFSNNREIRICQFLHDAADDDAAADDARAMTTPRRFLRKQPS